MCISMVLGTEAMSMKLMVYSLNLYESGKWTKVLYLSIDDIFRTILSMILHIDTAYSSTMWLIWYA